MNPYEYLRNCMDQEDQRKIRKARRLRLISNGMALGMSFIATTMLSPVSERNALKIAKMLNEMEERGEIGKNSLRKMADYMIN